MAKYGEGLNREIVKAVKSGSIKEPITIKKVKTFVKSKGWVISDKYTNSCLPNGTNLKHSPTYKKYFKRVGEGEYVVIKDILNSID